MKFKILNWDWQPRLLLVRTLILHGKVFIWIPVEKTVSGLLNEGNTKYNDEQGQEQQYATEMLTQTLTGK